MKSRLDIALTQRGLCQSRERAKGVIMAGLVYVNNQKADKPGQDVSEQDNIELRGEMLQYVSRGGLKLEKALKVFPISLEGAVCGDFGASTGGFTDCMLQNGAQKVYAVDVGYGQLAWKLRQDPRVINLERTNARNLTPQQIPQQLDFISVDVSFISLGIILPVIAANLKPDGQAVCLVKPQFEAGRELVGKKGVVRDKAVHIDVVARTVLCATQVGLSSQGLDFSPVKGPEGNIEFVLHIVKTKADGLVDEQCIKQVVDSAHQSL